MKKMRSEKLKVRGGRTAKGFTLVEALVAMVVIALVLPVALQAISLSVQLGADAKLRGEAAQLAKGKLDELVATGEWKNSGLNGTFENEGRPVMMTWASSSSGWGDGTLDQVEVTVSYVTAGKTRSVTITTLVNPEAE